MEGRDRPERVKWPAYFPPIIDDKPVVGTSTSR